MRRLFPINILHRQTCTSAVVRTQMKSERACFSVSVTTGEGTSQAFHERPDWRKWPVGRKFRSKTSSLAVAAYRPGRCWCVLPCRGKWRGYRPPPVKVASSPTRPRQGGSAGPPHPCPGLRHVQCKGMTCVPCTRPSFLPTHASPHWYEVKAQAPDWDLPAQYPRCVAPEAHAQWIAGRVVALSAVLSVEQGLQGTVDHPCILSSK